MMSNNVSSCHKIKGWHFLMERRTDTMSVAHNRENTTGVNGTHYGIGNRPPISHPQNCSQECPYGHDRSFCFPCYKKLMEGTEKGNVKDGV